MPYHHVLPKSCYAVFVDADALKIKYNFFPPHSTLLANKKT
jgi:hypothetical protein